MILLVAALAAAAARMAAPTEAPPTKPSRALICGSERWVVKTLQDRPRLLPARRCTVEVLSSLSDHGPHRVTGSRLSGGSTASSRL